MSIILGWGALLLAFVAGNMLAHQNHSTLTAAGLAIILMLGSNIWRW